MQTFFRFSGIMLVVVVATFAIHISILDYYGLGLYENRITLAYVGNFILALAILFGLLHAPKKLQNSLGFLFMIGSIFKFIFFFAFFYPHFLTDGSISRPEFFAFFAPYSACLATETKLLINRLSKD